jgi:hypothetical protein
MKIGKKRYSKSSCEYGSEQKNFKKKKNTNPKKKLLIKNGLNKFKFETKMYLTTRTAYET